MRGPFDRFCGQGELAACRASLWAAIDAAGTELANGRADPDAWRADAAAERIPFDPGVLGATLPRTNSPTFQQVLSFKGRRHR